ncbi:hypothetical protein [Longimicrobium sp.]|uniref:hypothetical protein n=1 Tax=Longimicrobium sp. TaxID=2029185 RepID=UPI003B3A83FC
MKAENRHRAAGRRQKRGEKVRLWRKAAGGAIVLMLTMLVLYLMGSARSARPIPARGELERIEGTVAGMRIRRGDGGGCRYLTVRIDIGQHGTRPWSLRAGNDVVCEALKGVDPLPRGAPVTVLLEWTSHGWVVWEMTSGGRRLVAYEQMRARREHQQRVAGWGQIIVYVLCVPFLLIVVVYVCMELFHQLARLVDRG